MIIPLQLYWILAKATPLVAENRTSALLAAVPVAVVVAVGMIAQLRPTRAALIRIEWLLHWTSAVCMTLLLTFIVLREPLFPVTPIGWPLCFWSVCISFTLLSNLALHERMQRQAVIAAARLGWFTAAIIAILVWCIGAILAADALWPPYVWTASIVFHAFLAFVRGDAATAEAAATRPGGRWAAVTAVAEAMLAISIMLPALLKLVFSGEPLGSAELKYFQFVNLCVNGPFLAGAALALVAYRLQMRFVSHAVAVGLAIWGLESVAWCTSVLLGYGLLVLYLTSVRQGPLTYAISLVAVTGMWLLGLLGFALGGLIVLVGTGGDFIRGLVGNERMVIPVLYGLWLIFAIVQWRRSKSANDVRIGSLLNVSPSAILSYAATWALVLLPIVCLWAVAMRPVVRFARPARIEVEEMSGICHTGYSRSEKEYAALAALGSRLTRVPIIWSQIQPKPDKWDFSAMDAFLDAAEKHGMKVVLVLGFDNDAVEQSPVGAARNGYIVPSDFPLFREYIERSVRRYKDRAYAWEIWNEPDIVQFWGGTMDEFFALARCAAEAVRHADPKACLLGTAMTSLAGVYGVDGIERLHASGALDQVDHPVMHTYISDPRGYYGEFLRVRNAAAKYGHSGSIWITELGITNGGVYPWRVPTDCGAEHVIKAYAIAAAMGVDVLMWHCHQDAPFSSQRATPLNSEHFFGIVNAEEKWKPAAHAFSLFAKHCNNSVIRRDLVELSGGVAARQVRQFLFRRSDGFSTLILWFEPALRPNAHARITVDLGKQETPAILHDIASGYEKPLLDPVVELTEKPLFITYKAPTPESRARLGASTSPVDTSWLVLLVISVAAVPFARRR